MIKQFITNRKKIFLFLVLSFALLFLFRLIYGYTDKPSTENSSIYDDFFSSNNLDIRNYATEKKEFKKSEPTTAQPQLESPAELAQANKYDKTATAKSNSNDFTNDEIKTRQLIKSSFSVIQYEKLFGNKNNRQMHLIIGVIPELFDSVYKEVIKIGAVSNPEVIKVDKTNEYRQLNARKISLEKSLESLLELKQKGGEIDEYISLNERILETEQQLQNLGVDLGNFNSANEFCTIRFSLYEKSEAQPISFMHRTKVALEWTFQYYSMFIFSILCIAIASWAIARASEIAIRIYENNRK